MYPLRGRARTAITDEVVRVSIPVPAPESRLVAYLTNTAAKTIPFLSVQKIHLTERVRQYMVTRKLEDRISGAEAKCIYAFPKWCLTRKWQVVEAGANRFGRLCKISIVVEMEQDRFMFVCFGVIQKAIKTFYVNTGRKMRDTFKGTCPEVTPAAFEDVVGARDPDGTFILSHEPGTRVK